MNIEKVNARVDQALLANSRAGRVIIGMASAIFILGVALIVVGFKLKNLYFASGSAVLQGLLVFPIREIKTLRRDNIVLQTFPVLIAGLSPNNAEAEIKKLLAHLRS